MKLTAELKVMRRFRRTTLITVGLFAFLAGLGLARKIPTPDILLLVLLFVFLLASVRKKNLITLLAVLIFGIGAGMWRGGAYNRQLDPYRQLSGKEVVFVGKVQSDATYGYQGQLSFDVADIEFLQPKKLSVPGRVVVNGHGVSAVFRGDRLLISGKLLSTKGSRQARVSFAGFTVYHHKLSLIEKIRLRFVAGIATALPEPSSSFGLGLLIGYRTTLPEITTEQLAITGLTHIIAVSGYNLTIIVRSTRRLLRRWSKYQQTMIIVALIVAFLLVTDFSASIVRASIVSGLSLAAWYYGRQFKPLLILGLAAVITAAWNPLYVWSDIGWYLSFLAFFGIMVVAPLALRVIYKKKRKQSQLVQILVETSAAQIMTAPLILFIFGRASLIGLVSNLIIGPLVPFAMLLTLVAGLSGAIFPILSGWLAWPARILLSLMLEIVAVFANVPHALIERDISLTAMILMYILLTAAILTAGRSLKTKYGTITDKNTII